MLRLIIVDDEEIIRDALSEMIDYASIGYDFIGSAKNGMEAFNLIEDYDPDVVITDIRMPILDGLQLIERVYQMSAHPEFILLSGYNEFEYAQKAMRYGVKHYLLKPTDRDELIASLQAIRREREQAAERSRQAKISALSSIRYPIWQCFMTECLTYAGSFDKIYTKYASLSAFPEELTCAILCTGIDTNRIKEFAKRAIIFLSPYHTELFFPVIATSSAVLFPCGADMAEENSPIRKALTQFGKSNAFSARLEIFPVQKASVREQLRDIIGRISHAPHISLLYDDQQYDIDITTAISPEAQQYLSFLSAPSNVQDCILDNILGQLQDLEEARRTALRLFLITNRDSSQIMNSSYDFIKRLQLCRDITEIRHLLNGIMTVDSTDKPAASKQTMVTQCKAYIESHLSSETLSLKWLAENYCFVSVGYLSKQFVRSEGIRFSDYLNRLRVKRAKELILLQHEVNIKSIAGQVGFASNPQYFGQVFKKYEGMTPSDYIHLHLHQQETPENI